MPDLKVEINTQNLNRALRVFPEQLKFEAADAMDHVSRRFFSRFHKQSGIRFRPHGMFRWFRRRLEGASLDIHATRSQTTSFISDILSNSSASPLDMRLEMYTKSKAARMHEFGGTISPGHMMPIPLKSQTQMFRQSGELKSNYMLKNMGGKLIPIRIRGHIYLVQVNKARHTIKPYYILLNEVKIKPRLGFYRSWDALQSDRIELMNKAIEKAIKKT